MATTGAPPRLVAVSGPAAGHSFVLGPGEMVAGRDAANAVHIVDPSLSRRHCAFSRTGTGAWIVHDLGSSNGTFVNGDPASERPLENGDRITIGASELLFHVESPPIAPSNHSALPKTAALRLGDAAYLRRSAADPGRSRTEHDLEALVRVGTALSRKRHRDELQRTLLDAAFEVVPASEAAFIRVDAAGARRNAIDTRTRREGVVPEPNGAVVELAISQREAILSNEVVRAPDNTAPRADGQHISSVLAVPLLDDDLVAGVLYLGSCDAEARFDRQHLELVTAIAAIGSIALKNVVRLESLVAETERLKQQRGITHAMIGTSEPMRRVYHFIEKVSRSDATVLITGETGTGKELAARAIHANSGRAAWPFVAINCAALTETLLEAELFGHERGAFTGAIAAKRGKLEVADRGTVFFDEVGELSPTLQSKLLRALQEREFERVGGTRPVKVDIRIISATNRDLEDAIAQGRFRQDLLFRLNVVKLHMPALRERQQDIAGLAEHFASEAARRSGRRSAVFTAAAIRRLTEYEWPGNVRELENAVERAVVLSSEAEIGVDDLPEAVIHAAGEEHADSSRFYAAVSDAKRRVVRDALDEANGRITDAARLLGLNANYLHRLLRTLKLRD